MSNAPHVPIDAAAFAANPYPVLAHMRAHAPIAFVPQLNATLLTKRDLIHREDKRIAIFSSVQPGGLMEKIMGLNMMRKDGAPHMEERKMLFPALSPRTVVEHWTPIFSQIVEAQLDALEARGACDLVTDFAMPVCGAALCAMTGLTNMTPQQMDRASQQMLDAVANYIADPQIDAMGFARSAEVDTFIDAQLEKLQDNPDPSILSVLSRAGMSRAGIGGNVKVIIGGGQNEPRDALAGMVAALLAHPDQHALIKLGKQSYTDAFREYTRLEAPIQMTPRMIARPDTVDGVAFETGDRVFLMYSSACRDEDVFDNPDQFDITRDSSSAIPFGAGPHFCAGAAASRALVAEVAAPALFERLGGLHLTGPVKSHGWAFRGPLSVPVAWG